MATASVVLLLIITLFTSKTVYTVENQEPDYSKLHKHDTVLISVLVRNKEHTLPYFLNCLEKLDYARDRISILFQSDHNYDRSIEILEKWLKVHREEYHSVITYFEHTSAPISGEEGTAHWPNERYSHVISLRERSLFIARKIWADFVWVLDADAFITNPQTLKELISRGYPISAPMLRSDGLYSNFWCGMTSEFYYKRTDEYHPILTRKNKGCHNVPMVHSAVLIDMRYIASDNLTYSPSLLPGYSGPHDDIITFAQSANMTGLGMYVCNEEPYGYVMVPLEKDDSLSYDLLQLKNLKLEVLVESGPLEPSALLKEYVTEPPPVPINIDKIFMINLERRPDRRRRMDLSFAELHLQVETVKAVDGQLLTDDQLERLGVHLMPGYKDPYHKRPMKRGEIGCFLSHYNIWQEVVRENYSISMILEDDVRFEPFFIQKLVSLLEELYSLPVQWDLVYLGRKRLEEKTEEAVKGTKHLVWAGYSYWTLGYLLSRRGARKLLAQDPLSNILPVDEYLPILYDKHPEEEWKEFYPTRDLVALSVEPLILYPAWYLHEEGYVSDTEDSPTVTTPNPEL